MKKSILMYVYGDISTDARVQRAATALSTDFNVTLVSTDVGKPAIKDAPYDNILVKPGKSSSPFMAYYANVRRTMKLVKRMKPDIFYGHDYYSAWLVKKLLGKKYCSKVIYDAHELIIPEEGKPFSRRSRMFYNFEKKVVGKVDLLICASEARGEIMKKHYGLQSAPEVIRNISQLSVNHDDVTEGILSSLDGFFKDPRLAVVYAGVVNRGRNLEELYKAVSARSSQCKLLVVGGGDYLDTLRSMAESDSALLSAFTGKVPYTALGAILSRCDVGFIYYPNNKLNNRYCASNKIYEYASVNLPIISNDNPTIAKDLDDFGIGFSSSDISEALSKVLENPSLCKSNCDNFNQANRWADEEKKLIALVNGVA